MHIRRTTISFFPFTRSFGLCARALHNNMLTLFIVYNNIDAVELLAEHKIIVVRYLYVDRKPCPGYESLRTRRARSHASRPGQAKI